MNFNYKGWCLLLYRLIVSDMDGTLLNSNREINEENIKAVKRVQNAGIEFAIATGRPYALVKDFLSENGLKCAVIGCNGGQIVDKDGRLRKSHYIKYDTLTNVLRFAVEGNFMYNILLDERIFTQLPRHAVFELLRFAKANSSKEIGYIKPAINFFKFIFKNLKLNEKLDEYVLRERPNIYKIDIMSWDRMKLDNLRKKMEMIDDIYITSSYSNNIEVGVSGVSKGSAVLEFAESLGINTEEIISFGDNYNDLSMIKAAGIGVAMGNAEDEIKHAADFVTLTNNESGVAYGINKLVFEGLSLKACTE